MKKLHVSFPSFSAPRDHLTWQDANVISSRSYMCGYCENHVASDKGWTAIVQQQVARSVAIHICSYCGRPTFFDQYEQQWPDVPFGHRVANVPDESITRLYDEARTAIQARCHTAAVLCCRKLLMHIAVEKGAQPGQRFIDYVEYLVNNHYVPPDAKGWVDQIRSKGNEANHEIKLMVDEDAEELVSFIEMLLKVIFEFPATIKKKDGP